ncbi:RNA polymerase sigma factor [Psychromarinibacter halotolerans]|uniref:RNA polymerase sigma factor n=1 Tax=Psychromarinibacter halotolerans TaxID=1775175 RepID=A0ABV7GQ81_9RHOB|nr:RNA polymerase sigma factor [Psychromarinibacter halotolerans]MAQ83326.1 RNA polymerase subunit sigma [Maritimibacter sp.]MDF0595635.1 RNA polymerase sigma factor [Psychromarinibacter halotolerans]
MTSDQTARDPRDDVVEHLPAMRAFAVSLTRDSAAADDLVQDTIVKAWKNFDKFKEGTNLRAWLFTILRNTFYSNLRKSKREVSDSDGAMAATLSEKPQHDGRLAMADFEKVFAYLPVEQREALILVGASGMSYEEAADTCEVAIGTIKSRVNRGRAKLVELLGIQEDEALEMTDSATLAVVTGSLQPRKNIA